jgi:flagellar basal body-associated protein FliL
MIDILIISVITVILAFGMAVFVLWAYRKGLKDAKKVEEGEPLPPLIREISKLTKEEQELLKQQEEQMDKLHQMMNFDPYKTYPKGEV